MVYKKGSPRSAAFTLMELLVVMAIISMLMSILMPSLNRARELSKSTVCLSNLRQFTLAWTIYASENNDKLCASDTEWNGRQPWNNELAHGNINSFWVSDGPGMPYNDYCGTELAIKNGILWPYVEDLELYKCKSDRGGFVRGYAISHAMGNVHKFNKERNFLRSSKITMPTKRTVFMDVAISPNRNSLGHMEGVGAAGSVYPIDTFDKHWIVGIKILTYRHSNGCNMSFADGHCKSWKWKDKRTMELMDNAGDSEKRKEFSIGNPDIPPLMEVMRGARNRLF